MKTLTRRQDNSRVRIDLNRSMFSVVIIRPPLEPNHRGPLARSLLLYCFVGAGPCQWFMTPGQG